MINNISEGSLRSTMKIEPGGVIHEKQVAQQKSEEVRQHRPVEDTDSENKSNSRNPQNSDDSKYLLEDNTLVFEKYNAKGDLIYRVPPPPYKPVDERA